MELKVIAYARNGHTDKFGIPRQSREESPILTQIVFEPEYNVAEALRGIEGFSHLWLLWGFSKGGSASWSPTVRPPRLGGNRRMGVFATRSPFRPNPIGLSSVRLIEVRRTDVRCTKDGQRSESTKEGRLELIVSGADVLDGTPIYDIKPYLSFSDSHEEARNGFAEETKDYELEVLRNDVRCTKEALAEEWGVPADVAEDILYILRQDPRPGYQTDPEREYKLDYGGWRVAFNVRREDVRCTKDGAESTKDEGRFPKSQVYIRSIYKVGYDTMKPR
ncbi:MAG: tRNA (N6-threonylcarbamoyladenosine(37)-N6)-methyltransferase TrmO [Paludibacteraceae bacterium]|nr:tRNA (N6-threonylcarbamoyladenosine(37)-N6)-methyltransferase TrmO [Paludibacteraceae bacterium]